MFYEIRKTKRILGHEDTENLLENAPEGVLASVGENGYPYTTPLNFAYREGVIYFHCAVEGHKIDNFRFNPKVSFCVIDKPQVLPGIFDTSYASAIAFGQVRELAGEEKRMALMLILEKYSSNHLEKGCQYIQKAEGSVKVFAVNVERLTGKTAHRG